MRNIFLIIKNNLYRLSKEKTILVMMFIVLPVVVYFGIFFSQVDKNRDKKIDIVGANKQQQEKIIKSVEGQKNINLVFSEKEPTKTELIKGIYLAEIRLKDGKPEVISYAKDSIKRKIEASIEGKSYKEVEDSTTVQGKIIGFLTMYLFFGSVMVMDFFLTDRENQVYVRALLTKLSYHEYIIGQLLYVICVLTLPSIIASVIIIKVLSVKLKISIELFGFLIFLVGLLSSSYSILICTIFKKKVSASMMASIITVITCLLGGCLVNIADSNKVVKLIRNCLPQKRLIDLANMYNSKDLIFLIVTVVLFISVSVFLGKRQNENGDFI